MEAWPWKVLLSLLEFFCFLKGSSVCHLANIPQGSPTSTSHIRYKDSGLKGSIQTPS